jgi:hypothetical protein
MASSAHTIRLQADAYELVVREADASGRRPNRRARVEALLLALLPPERYTTVKVRGRR